MGRAALNTLSITDWANNLEQNNQLFNSKFMERVQEAAEYSDVKITELRKEIGEKYDKLLQFIEAFATINPSEDYTQTIDLINALIHQYEKTIKHRAALRNTEEEETTENTPTS